MEILRTPDSHFEGLPDFNFEPHYTNIQASDGTEIRIHHIEEGPEDGPVIVMIHGNPTWSFLHRHMVKALGQSGCRAVAVDLVGLGRSDKPASRDDYNLANHVDWMTKWFSAAGFTDATVFMQDWGGTIGLIVAAENPDWFKGIIAANTGLPEGEGNNDFLATWVNMMEEATEFPWDMFKAGMMADLSEEIFQGYLAPFPDSSYMSGILKFPSLICVFPDNPGVPQCKAAWQILESYEKPVLTLYGDSDPVSAGMDKLIQERIPGATGQNHQVIAGAGHFIQEKYSDQLVPHITNFIRME